MRNSSLPVCIALLWITSLAFAPGAGAHPMGNFSINHYATIRIGLEQIELRYVIDMAEIPTFQEMQESRFPAQPQDPRVINYTTARARDLVQGLELVLGGNKLPLQIVSENVVFPPGAGNLPTLRLSFLSRAAIPAEAYWGVANCCIGIQIFQDAPDGKRSSPMAIPAFRLPPAPFRRRIVVKSWQTIRVNY